MKNALGSLSGTERVRVRENHHISGKEGDAFRSCSIEGGPPLSTLPVDVWGVRVCQRTERNIYLDSIALARSMIHVSTKSLRNNFQHSGVDALGH